MSPGSSRGGFTLLEVVVALVVGALVLLSVRVLADAVTDGAERVASASAEVVRTALPERELRSLLRRLEVTDSASAFAGAPRSVRFRSWCDVPAGWQERCVVQLAIEDTQDGAVLRLRTSSGEDLVVAPGVHASLHYLLDPRAGGAWTDRWGPSLMAPAALMVTTDRDTLILRIGERG